MKNFKMLIVLILSLALTVGCSKTSTTSSGATVQEPASQEMEEMAETKETSEKAPEEISNFLKDDEDYDIDDEFRDAMNLYEDFVDEYCEFMLTWMNADQNWQLNNMEKYVKYTQAITDCQEAINEALERKDKLTKDEYEYIVLVQTRTAQKLLNAATEGLNGEDQSN